MGRGLHIHSCLRVLFSLVGSQHNVLPDTSAQLVHFLPPLCQLFSVYHNSDKTLIALLTETQSAQSSAILFMLGCQRDPQYELACVLTILMDGLIPEKRFWTLLFNNFLFILWLQISPGPVRRAGWRNLLGCAMQLGNINHSFVTFVTSSPREMWRTKNLMCFRSLYTLVIFLNCCFFIINSKLGDKQSKVYTLTKSLCFNKSEILPNPNWNY